MLFDQDLLYMVKGCQLLSPHCWGRLGGWFLTSSSELILDLRTTHYRSGFWFELFSYFTLHKSHVSHFSCFPHLVILWLWSFSPSPLHLQVSLFLSLFEWNHTYGVLWLLVPTLPCSVISSHTYEYIFMFHSYQS